MNRTLQAALGLMYLQAAPGESGGTNTAPNPNAMSVETLAAMAGKNDAVQAKPSDGWHQKGIEMGQTILAAEQAIASAISSEVQTKYTALVSLTDIPTVVGRNSYIGGVDNAFIAISPAGKKSKGHQNILTDMRRVATYLNLNAPSDSPEEVSKAKEQALKWLNAKETEQPNAPFKKLPARIALFPTTSNSGGRTGSTGNSTGTTGQAGATPAVQTTGGTSANNPAVQQGQAAALASPPVGSVPQVQQPHAVSRDALVTTIMNCHEDDIEAAIVALANRCKQSPSPVYNGFGADAMDFIASLDAKDQVESQAQGGALPMAANG